MQLDAIQQLIAPARPIIAEMDMSTRVEMEPLGGKGLPAAGLRKG